MVESIGQLTKSSKMVSRESKEDKKMKKYEMKQVMVDPFDIMCGECAAELLAEPQFDFTVKFVEPEDE